LSSALVETASLSTARLPTNPDQLTVRGASDTLVVKPILSASPPLVRPSRS
jgi:hypothetical protein